jgi:seryl-tRNA synthetase
MIDLSVLREKPELLIASQRARGQDESLISQAAAADSEWRASQASFENLRANQNAHSRLVGQASAEDRPALVAEGQALAARVKEAERAAAAAEQRLKQLILQIDNLVDGETPPGTEADFVTLREVGEKPHFEFPVQDHVALGETLKMIDTERGAKISGSRFYFLRGWGARLELAIMQLALNKAIENGFIPLITPTLVRPEVMQGTGFLGEHAAEVYFLPTDDLYLTGTSEVALAGYHSDEILELTGPLRYAGWSTCYRREAGSHGKDTRGILRVHQFNKLEMFSYCAPEEANDEHLRLLAWQEEMLQACELPYRVIDVAAGDLGSSAARKFDIEAWVPSQQAYRELTSTSNCTTYQARRLNIRYREEGGKPATVATLNGTLATTRWLVAIIENHQQADGSIAIPAALQAMLGGTAFIRPESEG